MQETMRPRLSAVVGGFGVLLAGAFTAAHAQPASLHDIPWYMAHDAARAATLKLCRSDHRFARDVDCANAETAEDRLWSQRAAGGAQPGGQAQPGGRPRLTIFDDTLLSPTYWADNRLARVGTLVGCNKPIPTNQPDVCAAARQGEALDAARRSRP